MRQHLFVSIFVYLFIFMLSHCKRAENKTTSSPCPPIRPIDFRGPTGVPGAPGQKGDTGENSTAEIANLEKAATDIQRKTTEIFAVIRHGFMKLDNGWISPLNGFQYKFLTAYQNWYSSRSVCQRMGGDLATHGIQDWNTRRIIFDALTAPPSHSYWVGFEDESHEGNWRWINGRSSSTRQTALWMSGYPNGGTSNNCAWVHSSDLFMYSDSCNSRSKALCQKPI